MAPRRIWSSPKGCLGTPDEASQDSIRAEISSPSTAAIAAAALILLIERTRIR